MAWKIEFSEDAERDFELIFDHLFESYIGFGTAPADAFELAAARLEQIRAAGEAIGKAPHQGTLRDSIAPGPGSESGTSLRNVTIDRSIYWFDLDEARKTVRILAVFYGGQDHIRHMLARLLGD